MTRVLKTSGFLGLAVMMMVGLYQNSILAGGQTVPGWLVGGHAHLGVLSIIAIVLGFAVDAYDITTRVRQAVTGLFVVGQWLLPVSIWVGEGAGVQAVLPTTFLWGLFLVVAMLVMTYEVATESIESRGRATQAAPSDD